MTGVSISSSIARGIGLSRAVVLWLAVALALPFGDFAPAQSRVAAAPAGSFSAGEHAAAVAPGSVRMAGTETARLAAPASFSSDDDTPPGFIPVAALFASNIGRDVPPAAHLALRPSAAAHAFAARAPPARA